MAHSVRLTAEAEADLLDIWRYIAETDAVENADALLDRLEEACVSLAALPDKGHVPKELRRIDVLDFREIHFKPYRIIYESGRSSALIHAILDGRRDMDFILRRRLLRP